MTKNKQTIIIILIIFIFFIFFLFERNFLNHQENIVIHFWNGFTGPAGYGILEMVKDFNQLHPETFVKMQRMDWATYYNKVMVSIMANRGPDVFIVHNDQMNRFVQSGEILPLDKHIEQEKLEWRSDFAEIPWQVSNYNVKQWGITLDVFCIGLWYNKELFKKAGIVDDKGNPLPPCNLQEFLIVGKKLTQDFDNDGKIDQWGFAYNYPHSVFYSLLKQNGGSLLSQDGHNAQLNSPAGVNSLQLMVDFIYKYKIAPPLSAGINWFSFRKGEVGMMLEGIYLVRDLEVLKDTLDYGAAPIPQFGDVPAAWGGSHILVIRKGLPPEKEAECWKFIKYISEHSIKWAKGGTLPIRKSIIQSPEFRTLKEHFEFAKQISYVAYEPNNLFAQEIRFYLDTAIERALFQTESPQVALDKATTEIQALLNRGSD